MRARYHPVRIGLAALLFAALLLTCQLISGCRKPTQPAPLKPGMIVISCDTAGWIVPCGCTANQSGGVIRRATYLAKLRDKADVLYTDAGGAPAGDSAYQQVKFESILSGEKLMGCVAHNLGKAELALGPDRLREIAEKNATPLISANALDQSGKPIADAIRFATVGGKRIGIVGLVSPRFGTEQIRIEDPRNALAATESANRGRYDSLLVLAYMPEDELQNLASASPEVDAMIGGPTGQSLVPRNVGPVLMASATNKGKFVVRLDLPTKPDGIWTGEVDQMGPEIADDPQQLENLQSYLWVLRQKDFPASQTGLAPVTAEGTPVDYRVAGTASCVHCHSAVAASCQATHHARAWATLVEKKFEVDSYCQQCHTTGFGLPGGFESRARSFALTNVGCESCHGPSAAHVTNPQVHTSYTALDQCIRCHDHENSPAFDRPVFWARIKH